MAWCWSLRAEARRRAAGHARAAAATARAVAVAAAALALAGCLFRTEVVPPLGGEPLVPPATAAARRDGSLWRDNVSANHLFSDATAKLPGDLLTVVISEADSGSSAADTDTKSDAKVFGNLPQFFGLPQYIQRRNPDFDPDALLEAEAKRQWEGSGTTTRQGTLTARVTVEVKALSPAGNMWVQGDKIIAINNEDRHVVLSGWVRPIDVSSQNEVDSHRLSQARIDYYGMGPVGRQQKAGWGMFILDWVWPF
jgi:flagellar L-ring protein precursor FlgH